MIRKLFDDNTRVVIASKQNEVKIHDAEDIESSAYLMRKHIETYKRAALDYFYSLEYHNATTNSKTYQE